MTMLVLTNMREPETVDELDAIRREQLRVCGRRWDGQDLPPEQRLFPTDVEIETNLYTAELAVWDVLEGATHLYDAWFYAVDSGTIFRAGSTEVVCIVMQFDFQPENPADSRLAADLRDAARRAGAISV